MIASAKDVGVRRHIDDTGAVFVPIELKTTGTWWGTAGGAIRKALSEPGKKRLKHDLHDLVSHKRRTKPFGLVALLITDDNGNGSLLATYAAEAKECARSVGIDSVADEFELHHGTPEPKPIALQLVWWLK